MIVIWHFVRNETNHRCEWILRIFYFSKMPIRITFNSRSRTRTVRKTPLFCKLHFAKSTKVRIFRKKKCVKICTYQINAVPLHRQTKKKQHTNMNAKFLVPYETAQLLKENGYNIETDYYYNKETKMITPLQALKDEWYPDSLLIIIDTRYIPAPTYHEVLDWLFDRGVSIWARSNYGKIDWFPVVSVGDNEYFPSGWYLTREEALNKAILEAIRLYI